ncbi:PPA1309 family protein [Kineosporia mesophila]|nr:PPA1309 family protein [Kineosporia mesophila]
MRAVTEELADPRSLSVRRVIVELERHVATAGWDAPVRVFALVKTAAALQRDPSLGSRLPTEVINASQEDPDHLTAVEQEGLPQAQNLEELLHQIAWPESVDGCAVVVERTVLPPEVEEQIPDDEESAAAWIEQHPDRRDVRLGAAVLRSGEYCCAVRARDHDADDNVAVGRDLAPGLVEGVAATLD